MPDEIIMTKDGSHSILSDKFGVSYHSIHGAIQETYHVFIKAGLEFKTKINKNVSILEIGWGTGLNSYITLIEAKKNNYKIDFTTTEAYPISLEQAAALNYDTQLESEEKIITLHELNWNEKHQLNQNFLFEKRQMKFQDISDTNQYDVIYFDAFAPTAQAEFWEEIFLKKMYDALKTDGILVTYCAKGSFKRALKAVGFDVEKLQGPPGKREMTRAKKLA